MIKILTDLKEDLSFFKKLEGFKDIHIFFVFKCEESPDIVDFFNKAIILSKIFRTTLLLSTYEKDLEVVKQIKEKYKSFFDIQEVDNYVF